MAQVDVKKIENVDKLVAVRDQLLTRWTERVMQTVGDSLSNVIDLSVARAPMMVELDGARMGINWKAQKMSKIAREDEDEGVDAEDEEHVDTSIRTGAGPQDPEDMRASNIGEEPVFPEASGEESDSQHGVAAINLESPERQGLEVQHFLIVDSPEKCLLLTETAFLRTGGAVTFRELVDSAMASTITPDSIVPHDSRSWLFTFTTAEAASNALGVRLSLRGRAMRLSPYKQPLAQTFMGKAIPPSIDVTSVVAELHRVFPADRIYIGLSPSKNKGRIPVLVVIFETPSDIAAFELKLHLRNGRPPTMKFHARSDNLNCYSCKRKHPLAECAMLSPVQVPLTNGFRRLLTVPPSIQLA
ncbi:hypothetical protein LTR17_011095 [Elasticomyces elasticus]|nr:hypothetical protein LTR17_011095 [Elasticomyces elasticus]